MKVELEARYYGVDDIDILDRLEKEDAIVERVCRRSLARRCVWDIDATKRKFLRVREYRGKTEIAVKRIEDSASVKGTFESSFLIHANKLDSFMELFRAIGLGSGSYQENERDWWRWKHHEGDSRDVSWVCDITLDYWPGLKPIVEIEVISGGPEAISFLEDRLRLSKRFKGDIADIYTQEHGISREDLSKIRSLTAIDFPIIPF
jgi:hypothetical protein